MKRSAFLDGIAALRKPLVLLLAVFACAAGLALRASPAAAPPPITVLTVNGAIGPATAEYVERGLEHAESTGSQLVVLRMDTPGGLDVSMRRIIKAILASPIPVATYVAPSGARAASAGTYILYASHVAAMANGTNLGAATPVQLGFPGSPEPGGRDGSGGEDHGGADRGSGAHHDSSGQAHDGAGKQADRAGKQTDAGKQAKGAGKQGQGTGKEAEGTGKQTDGDAGKDAGSHGTAMQRKQINDAAAYIRGLAEMRGRNAQWAERAVREAVSLTAVDALKEHVIDYVAADAHDLMRQLDGKRIETAAGARTLATAGAATLEYAPDWRIRFLSVITDPSMAMILMMIGIYGLMFEFLSPGYVAPGVIGGICLLLALFALQLLPVNYAGLALALLGVGLMIAEAFLPTFGIIGIGGVISLVVGAIILVNTDAAGFGVPLPLVAAVGAGAGLLVVIVAALALRVRRRPIVSGREGLVGMLGQVVQSDGSASWASVQGELWRVASATPLEPGARVKVVGVDGLTLRVTSA